MAKTCKKHLGKKTNKKSVANRNKRVRKSRGEMVNV